MKILIAYAGKSGTTEKCAKELASLLSPFEITLTDLGAEFPDPAEYDATVVGASIRMGKLHRAAVDFLHEKETALLSGKLYFFLCCGSPERADEYFETLFPERLIGHAGAALPFGGEAIVKNQKGLDRLMLRLILHHIRENNRDEDRDRDIPLPSLLPENIRRMASSIRSGF